MNTVQRDRRYWLCLMRLAAVALAVGLVGSIVGSGVLGSAFYAHALTHPGCVETRVAPEEWEQRVVTFFDGAF